MYGTLLFCAQRMHLHRDRDGVERANTNGGQRLHFLTQIQDTTFLVDRRKLHSWLLLVRSQKDELHNNIAKMLERSNLHVDEEPLTPHRGTYGDLPHLVCLCITDLHPGHLQQLDRAIHPLLDY